MLQIGTHPDSAGSARPPGLVRTATTYSVSTTSASVSRCPYVVPQASPGPSDAGLKHKGLTNSEGLTECGPPAYYCQHQLVNLKMIATKSLAWKWYRQTCGGIALVGENLPFVSVDTLVRGGVHTTVADRLGVACPPACTLWRIGKTRVCFRQNVARGGLTSVNSL